MNIRRVLKWSGIAAVLAAAGFIASPLGGRMSERSIRDREARLQPAIQYMNAFIKEHDRLPTQEEFRVGTQGMFPRFVLKDYTDNYAASKGAKFKTDYMVGYWHSDWYHYYKSWDRSFLSGSDEFRFR